VVLVEQSLDMVSFRPQFRIPRWVPLAGTVGCMFAMFIISPIFGLVAVTIVVGLYGYLVARHLNAPHGDMRSGLFLSLAEWAAKKVSELPTSNERAWKPNLLVPFDDARELRGLSDLIRSMSLPRGSVTLLGMEFDREAEPIGRTLIEMGQSFRDDGVYTRWTTVEATSYDEGVGNAMDTLAGSFFRPNILFLRMPEDPGREEDLRRLIAKAGRRSMGVALFHDEPVARLGARSSINVWITDQSSNWDISYELGNVDLALLTAYKLQQSWDARVRVVTAIEQPEHVEDAREFLANLLELARMSDFEILIEQSDFETALRQAPQADIELFGLPAEQNFEFMHQMVELRRSACMFINDSGEENVLA